VHDVRVVEGPDHVVNPIHRLMAKPTHQRMCQNILSEQLSSKGQYDWCWKHTHSATTIARACVASLPTSLNALCLSTVGSVPGCG
jgi:hypothetical protein